MSDDLQEFQSVAQAVSSRSPSFSATKQRRISHDLLGHFQELFRILDSDASGKISVAEIDVLFKQIHPGYATDALLG